MQRLDVKPNHDGDPISEPDKFFDNNPTRSPYDRTFLLCYLANTAMLVGVSLLFRYEDFVKNIGGTVFDLGLIVGIGTTGAITARLAQGLAIDRIGPRKIWLLCLAIYAASLFWHLRIEQLGVEVYFARILMNTSLAGAFGSSIAFISLRSPANRVAETLGVLGSSGFIGMALGPVVGDMIFAADHSIAQQTHYMFMYALIAIGAAFFFVLFADDDTSEPTAKKTEPILSIVRKHHPGFLLVVGMAMGLGISLPHSFLRPYVKEIGIDELKTFFLCYAIVAFVTRLATRKLPDLLGFRLAILLGLGSLAISMPTYLLVTDRWMLMIPATIAGVAHAFLFPAVVAAACASFPSNHRGVATSMILGMFDLGVFVGAPLIGGILRFAEEAGMAAYPTMFSVVCGLLSTVAIVYFFAGKSRAA